MAFRQGPDCRLPSNIPEELDNQSTSSKQVLEDELVLALDTIKQLKEQLRESRRSNTFSAEEIREDEIRTGRDNEQRRSRPRFSPLLGDVELERTRPRTGDALRGREGGQYDTYYHQPYVTHENHPTSHRQEEYAPDWQPYYNLRPPRQQRHAQPRRRLKPDDIMLFDPKTVDVKFFIRRIKIVAAQEGEGAVLDTLPFCLKGRSLEWHTTLPEDVHEDLATSLSLWIRMLDQEFSKDPIEARRGARRLRFSFNEAAEMSLADYLTKKINLLNAAGTFDVETLKSELWEGLDAKLAYIARPEIGESLETFRRRIRDAEPAARREWESSHRMQIAPRPYPRPQQRLEEEPITKDRVQRLMSKWGSITDEKQKEGDTKPLQPSQQDRMKARRAPLRPCRHCGASHWDFDCPTRKVNFAFGGLAGSKNGNENMETNENSDPLDEQDLETLNALEAMASDSEN
jgi:hypothetical protein